MIRRLLASPLLQVVGVRALTFPIVLGSGLLWLRLVIGHLGTSEYAFVALIVGLQFLLGFLDFGTSGQVLEGAGRYRADHDVHALGRAVGAASRSIVLGNALVLGGASVLLALGAWGPILGFPERTSTAGVAIILVLAVNALVRPLSLSTALVAGLGRPAVATWAQALTGVSSLGILLLLLSLDAPVVFIPVTPIAGQLVAYLVSFVLATKMVPGLCTVTAGAMLRRPRSDQKLRHLAVPMLIIQAIGPLNDQLDRLFLSHLSTVEALALFSLGVQLLAGAESFVTVLTPQLWAEFAELRAKGGPRAAVARALVHLKRLWPIAILFGATFAVLARIASPWISEGKLQLPWLFCVLLGSILCLSIFDFVIGISLTDRRSLRTQAAIMVGTVTINLALTAVLSAPLGPLGPASATLTATSIHLLLLLVVARRRWREADERHEPTAVADPRVSLARGSDA